MTRPYESHHIRGGNEAAKTPRLSEGAIVLESIPEREVLHVFGEIDLSNVGELRSAIEGAAATGHDVVVDLEPCTYIDSSTLGVLVAANQTYAGRFHIVVPATGVVRRVFAITSLLRELPVIDAIQGRET